MEKVRIEMENGQILSSGQAGTAVMSLQLTQAVNSGQELALGAVCAAMAELGLITDGTCPIRQGETFTLYRGERKLGVFTAEKPQWESAHRVSITAYDNITKLDRDLSGWLQEKTDWPCTLRELAQAVCGECGLSLADTVLPNGDFPVSAFTGQQITGRQILGWIGQATGRFCRALPDGTVDLAWYTPGAVSLGPARTGDDVCYYYQGSLTLADYETAPIEKVQIRQSEGDVGILWPDIGQANTYILSGNPLLTAEDAEQLLPVAQSLYEQLRQVCYTPCSVTVQADAEIEPGQILQLLDQAGTAHSVYIMETRLSGNRTVLKCTGSASRDSTTAANHRSYEVLNGKVMTLQTNVEGLRAENADMQGNAAALSMTVAGIESKVTAQGADMEVAKQSISTLAQDADGVKLQLQTIEKEGVSRVTTTTGYSFSEEGLRISRSGLEMENLLDHTGMYVSRNAQVILQANNRGVVARDVTVKNYLILGSHARLEDYDGGTACFYI